MRNIAAVQVASYLSVSKSPSRCARWKCSCVLPSAAFSSCSLVSCGAKSSVRSVRRHCGASLRAVLDIQARAAEAGRFCGCDLNHRAQSAEGSRGSSAVVVANYTCVKSCSV
jgi:hypothetical protein